MKNFTVAASLVLILLVGCVRRSAADPPQALAALSPPGSDRLRIFISDTHFGPGPGPSKWHPYEDFRWAPEFELFLHAMERQANGNGDLILTGDTFELWQSLADQCVVKDRGIVRNDLGCSEQGALRRIEPVLKAHRREMNLIGEFASDRSNRVIMIPGNHDAVLLFPAVAKAALDALGAPPGHAEVKFDGYWSSPDGLLYAEHGHQIAKEVNNFDNWPNPFKTLNGVRYILRPWGQQFVQQYYNPMEVKYPIIDNVLGDANGIKFGMKAEGRSASWGDVGKFFSFYLLDLSFKQAVTPILGGNPGEPPVWDYAAIRAQGDRFLVDSIPADDDFHAAAQQQFDIGQLNGALKTLSDDDIANICNFRQNAVEEAFQENRQPPLGRCPAQLGAVQSLLDSRDKIFRDHFKKLFDDGRAQRQFQVFVWGHTHVADPGFRPRSRETDGWNPLVINTGAWQRTIVAEKLTQIKNQRGLTDKQLLQQVPEDLPGCYSFVLVKPYARVPEASLQFWRKTAAGWSQGASCE